MPDDGPITATSRTPVRDYLAFRWLALVAVGGAVGTALRMAVSAIVPSEGPFPIAVIVVNLSGAFILGWLLEALALRGQDTIARRGIRLGVGTGVLGGYTTYSAFALASDGLIDTDNLAVGLFIALPTVIVGVVLASLGAATARTLQRTGRGR